MNIIRCYITFFLASLFWLQGIAGEQLDSLKATTLKELVVESDSQFTNATTTTYLVGKNQRKHAADGIQLLQMMNISQVIVDPINRSVTTASNEPVALFINGLPAEQEDVDNLFCKDAIKVEYIVNSSDPRFLGHKNVVNYVMQRYEYGGYTRLNADVYGFREYEYGGSIYSKFNYKKMTFDVSALGKYSDVKRNGVENTETYLLADKDDQINEVVRKVESGMGESRSIEKSIPNASFRATYAGEKITILNQIGMALYDYPVIMQNGRIEVRSSSVAAGRFSYNAPLVNRDFNWNGYYLFTLPKGYSLTMRPSFTFSNNSNWSTYHTDVEDYSTKIVNDYREKVYRGILVAEAQKSFAGKHNLNLHYDIGFTKFNTRYSGNSAFDSRPASFDESLSLSYTYNVQKWNLRANPTIDHTHQSTPDGTHNYISPSAYVSAAYSPDRRNQISVNAAFTREAPQITNSEDFILQVNEFLYKRNGLMRPEKFASVSAGWWFAPCNAFNFQIAPNYEFRSNTRKYEYEPYLDGQALLRTTFNNGDLHKFFVSVMANVRLFDNRLSVMAYPRYSVWKSTGYDSFTKHHVSFWMHATYMMGQFYLQGFLSTPSKEYRVNNICAETPLRYHLTLGWSIGAWNLRLTAINPFANTRCTIKSSTNSQYYKSESKMYGDALYNRIGLSVSYTFNYGKKVSGDELNGTIEHTSLKNSMEL